MRNLIALASITVACFIGGCQSDGGSTSHKHSTMKSDSGSMQTQTVAKDACTHCPGLQTVTADGKCPSCGMAMNKQR